MREQTEREQVSPQEQEGAERRSAQIARLKNEQLLQLLKGAEKLYQDTRYATLALNEEQKSALAAVSEEAQTLKELLHREYAVRVLRGYQAELKKLLAAVQPTPPAEAGGRLLPLPIRAGVTSEDVAPFQQPDPFQDALNTFAEQIRVLMASNLANPRPDRDQEPEERP
jgi:hypothetical protein